MRSKRQCKTGAIQLRTTATRTIKRHAVNRTVNRQSSGAILAELKHRLSEIYDLTAAGSVLTWDEATYMPKGGTVARGRQSSLLRRLAHERFVDPALGRLIDRLEPGTDKLPADDASLIRIVRRDYERAIRVPAEYVARANAHGSASYNAWIWARPANDFAAMIPFLEKTLDLRREYASFFAPYDHIADPMIDDADEGMTTATIQRLFAELRRELIPMVRAICDQPPADDGCLRHSFGEEAQLGFGLSVATQMGYDLERGRLDQTHHPFCTKFAAGDVRITTRVRENHIGDALFSTLHEAGHAMYEQGVNAAYEGTPLGSGVSLGVHESQSRLWENVVARSRPFWGHYYPALQRTFAHQLGSVPVDGVALKSDGVALKPAADASEIPVHVLQAAVAIVRRRHAKIGLHAGAPCLRQVLDPEPSFEELQLQFEPQHDVKVVGHFVSVGADERGLHLVDGAIKDRRQSVDHGLGRRDGGARRARYRSVCNGADQ